MEQGPHAERGVDSSVVKQLPSSTYQSHAEGYQNAHARHMNFICDYIGFYNGLGRETNPSQ